MPSQNATPSVLDLIRSFVAGVRRPQGTGEADRRDTRRGSMYEAPGGVAAQLVRKSLQTLRERARSRLLTYAKGDRLDALVVKYFNRQRVAATFGVGAVHCKNSGGSSETIVAGTRFSVFAASGKIETYEFTEELALAGHASGDAAIRAIRSGPGVSVVLLADMNVPWQDSTGEVALRSMYCADGLNKETDEAYLSRARREFRADRDGFRGSIQEAMRRAGASSVVLIDSAEFSMPGHASAEDLWVSNVYVGSSEYSTDDALLDACLLALDSVDACGTLVQVRGMETTDLDVVAAIELWDGVDKYDLDRLRMFAEQATAADLVGRPDWWTFTHDGIGGAILRALPMASRVSVTTFRAGVAVPEPPPSPPPDTLSRYKLHQFTATFSTFSGGGVE